MAKSVSINQIRLNHKFTRYGIRWALQKKHRRNEFDAKYSLLSFNGERWITRAFPDTVEAARTWIRDNHIYLP